LERIPPAGVLEEEELEELDDDEELEELEELDEDEEEELEDVPGRGTPATAKGATGVGPVVTAGVDEEPGGGVAPGAGPSESDNPKLAISSWSERSFVSPSSMSSSLRS